jgi:hypothetical protein
MIHPTTHTFAHTNRKGEPGAAVREEVQTPRPPGTFGSVGAEEKSRASWFNDIFVVPFDEIDLLVGHSPDAAWQLASRAWRWVRQVTPNLDADLAGE